MAFRVLGRKLSSVKEVKTLAFRMFRLDPVSRPEFHAISNGMRIENPFIPSVTRSSTDLFRVPSEVRSQSSSLTPWFNNSAIRRPAFQQVRNVYVEVIDNDLDAAIKVYRKKMMNTKVEEKLREKRYYSKPSERRKLAKHYKKLNRARRELSAKIRIVKHRMEKIQEVRKLEKEEKRAKAAAAATSTGKSSQSSR